MDCFKIFREIGTGLLYSPIILNSILVDSDNIKIGLKNNEITYRPDKDIRVNPNSGNIGWNCFLSNNDAIIFYSNFTYFRMCELQEHKFVVYSCEYENLYIKRDYMFNTKGLTCQFIRPTTLTWRF